MTSSFIKTKTYAKPLAAAITAAISTLASAQGVQNVQELSVTQAQTQSDASYKVDESSSPKISKPLLDTAKNNYRNQPSRNERP